ncbi:hypothetical protein [Aquibium oceanicum]|uniref:hypothetical protein n=1 Tax=Aquibium oceanicum TaxID=1670800 RepID=UPI0012FFBC2E|nr:hypothetical protein [Aquibium oceanicum]
MSFGPNVILQRPELAAQIGNIIANWTLVEADLLSLYAIMMGDYLSVPVPAPEWSAPPSHPVARQIFEQVQSFNARLDLVEALLKWRGLPEEIELFSQTLRKRIKTAYHSRNSVAHDGWGISSAHTNALILSSIHGHPVIYKLRDFEQISQAICDVHLALGKFSHSMYERRLITRRG